MLDLFWIAAALAATTIAIGIYLLRRHRRARLRNRQWWENRRIELETWVSDLSGKETANPVLEPQLEGVLNWARKILRYAELNYSGGNFQRYELDLFAAETALMWAVCLVQSSDSDRRGGPVTSALMTALAALRRSSFTICQEILAPLWLDENVSSKAKILALRVHQRQLELAGDKTGAKEERELLSQVLAAGW